MGEGAAEMESRALPHHQLQWVLFKQTFEKYTDMLMEWEQSLGRVTNIIWDQSFKQISLAPLSQFPFPALPRVKKSHDFYASENTKIAAGFTTDFLSLTLHLSFYGLWVLFLIPAIKRVHVRWNRGACALPGAPAGALVPPGCARSGSFLLHIKIRSKCSGSWWPLAYRLTIYNSWSLIPRTYTLILAHSY